MPVYCVTYDLGGDGNQDYDKVIAAIRSLGAAVEVTASTWLVSTAVGSEEVTGIVSEAAGRHAKLVVFGVGACPIS